MGRRKKLVEIARLEGNPGRRPLDVSGVEGLGEPFIPEHSWLHRRHQAVDAAECLFRARQLCPVRICDGMGHPQARDP